ncbi:MAG: short chain dehydrogenase family protein 39 [Nocardia sp.]|uniref:SDR family NAD(P)-dependent oxidoreductase n=1 Tax=Nocardia sp. TaxID=1821 RepID=UPI0026031CA0|nr:SDR family NAD(P)-dependent oxidoreductase [Nocardia sp.]MCU1641343.1 short chain dehydrogenase family protein 39 [Nocardia sp.]
MGILDNRVAVITGGGRGIGAALARAFAQEGAAVVVNDLGTAPDGVGGDKSPVHEIVEEIRAAGGQAIADDGDIADVATGRRLVETAVDEYGKLDVLVNVAGILRDRMIFNLPEEDWDAVIRVHLKGHYSTVRPAAAYFREQRDPGGNYRIINFTSVSGLQGSPGQPNYAAAKMGIVGLTYSLAQGLSRYGVTANAIAPGAATRLVATIPSTRRPGGDGAPAVAPIDMSPDNIAPLALYLASERSSWLTGRTLSAQGYEVGLYANPVEIAKVAGDRPWQFENLATEIEGSFRPLADGLPPSIFAAQLGH